MFEFLLRDLFFLYLYVQNVDENAFVKPQSTRYFLQNNEIHSHVIILPISSKQAIKKNLKYLQMKSQ